MSWQLTCDIREMFVEMVATDGSKTIFGRNINRKDQLHSGLAEALAALPPGFKAQDAQLSYTSDLDTISIREHWGSHTAFLTTEGFENLLEIGNQSRIESFGLAPQKELPLISRDFSFGVTERTQAGGAVEVGLDEKEIEFVMSKLNIAEVKSVAICFLHANKNPLHEKQLAAKLSEKGYEVVCSHEFEGNELERAQKACAKAFALTSRAAFLAECEKLGFQKSNISELDSRKNAVSKNSVLRLQFLEDRVRIGLPGGTILETATTPLCTVTIDEGGLVHVGPGKIESEPGPVAFGKGIHLSLLDLLAFTHKLKAGARPVPRLKLDPQRALKQLAPIAKQLQLDPETCAKKFINLFYEKLISEIRWAASPDGILKNWTLEAHGWLARVMAYPVARGLEVRNLKISKHDFAESWGDLDFSEGGHKDGESVDF